MGFLLAAGIGALIVNHSKFRKAAAPWRTTIAKSAAANNVNANLLAAILWQESRFDPKAVGSAGEVGMGQFKQIAADDVNMDFEEIEKHAKSQIEAAARLIKINLDRSGDIWTSIRAYNAGIGRAQKDLGVSVDYALAVFKNAIVDWIYDVFTGYAA